MKELKLLFVSQAVMCCATTVLGTSHDMPLTNKVSSLPVVAEVRIERIEVRPDPPNKFQEVLCDCEVLRAFKLPFITNKLTLRMNFTARAAEYKGKRAMVFAFESPYGHFSPYGGEEGFILEGGTYNDRYSHRKIKYTELIQVVKAIAEANPQGGANGRQPPSSNKNQTPEAAAARRSP